MKAIIYQGPQRVELQDIEQKACGETDVRIQIRACGVCGTDIHIYHGDPGSVPAEPPVVLGHEFAGEVAEIGSQVSGIQVGDIVTVDPNMPCGQCGYCRSGIRHLCTNLFAIGVNSNGGFAEHCTVDQAQVYVFPSEIRFLDGALAEPVACCLHGIDRAGIRSGHTVAVVGAGPIGLIMVQLALLSGAARVYVSEPNPIRRELASQFGAVAMDPSETEITELLLQHTGLGVDVAIECAGTTPAMVQAFHSVRKGGVVVLFSVPSPDAQLSLPAYDIFSRELTIKGAFTNPHTHERAVRLIAQDRLELGPIVSHRFPLAEFEQAIKATAKPESIKVCIEP